MNKHVLAVVLGFAGWLIGYLAGIPLLAVPEYMHTAEQVLMIFFGMLFAAWYFFRATPAGPSKGVGAGREVPGPYMKEGLRLGMIWLVLMVVLDYILLVPLMGGDLTAWFASIGLGYLAIPIQMTIFGWTLDRIKK